ncbi:MAG TPA: N-acyl homoserine lactonase family protein [Chitinophagaceae bacterium]
MKKLILSIFIILFVYQIGVSQTENYEVYALKFASMTHPTPVTQWAQNAPPNDSVNIDFMIWLIKGNNGRNVLVDAGFLKDLEDAKDFGFINYTQPDSMLLRLSLQAKDITDIILSHPHWDHIDGVGLFPNAHIWMQKEDFNYFTGTAWQKDGKHGGFNKNDVHKLLDLNLEGKLTLVDGDDKEIIPGIKVYTGSRHTFNSQYVLVETGLNKVILASDNIWIYYNLDHLQPPPSYGTFDTSAYIKSMQRMKTLVSDTKYIIPGHDSKIFSIFPSIADGIVKIR